MKIGPYQLQSNLLLAPMAGVTDRPFRRLCREFGAGLTVSEMMTSDIGLWASRKSRQRRVHSDEAEPRSVQIAGTEPPQMAEAARMCADNGAQIIDINMGCPAKKVLKKAAGSALMRDEALVARILDAVVRAVPIPVTLKMRTGWDLHNRNAVSIAKIAENCGIQALAVHGRSRDCAYRGEAEFDTVREVKQAVHIPVIANGDISSADKAREVLHYTGTDALMIGRAAQGQPWIFSQLGQQLQRNGRQMTLSTDQKCAVVLRHLEEIHRHYDGIQGIRVARKHIGWYLVREGVSQASIRQIFASDESAQQLRQVEKLYQDLASLDVQVERDVTIHEQHQRKAG